MDGDMLFNIIGENGGECYNFGGIVRVLLGI
jgi:hypothetical protein